MNASDLNEYLNEKGIALLGAIPFSNVISLN